MRFDFFKAGIMMAIACMNISSSAAQTVESLIMPGPVIEGHAEIESECSSCHVHFSRADQDTLCLDCHKAVKADTVDGTGFHGRAAAVKSGSCVVCHTDHEGREADIVNLNEAEFDHEMTDFVLAGKHRDVTCDGCHEAEKKHREAPGDCVSCHEDDDVHEGLLGASCGDCHTESDWLQIDFDHDTTDYPLLGKHQDTACDDCHEDMTYRVTPTTCYGCHAEDDAHNGLSGNKCETCHNPSSWNDSSFDHARDTDFVLDGGHSELACDDCHSEDPFSDSLKTSCVSCHLEDDEHDGHFGDKCESCHGTDDWSEPFFDHDTDTNYLLNGAHKKITCDECHIEPIFEVKLETGCNDCHADDDPHESGVGIVCSDCHNEASWQDDLFFDHDLTRFPLLGSHAEADCESCHETHVFQDAPEQCIDCHADDDKHEGRFDADCAACHNPVDWLQWHFDHNTQTDFQIIGAHVDVACDDCHRQPLPEMLKLGARCGDCHRADDIHDGEFGSDCGRCHSSGSFS